jgi:hypothetical protein
LPQEVRAHGPEGLIRRHGGAVDRVEQCQPGRGTVRFGHRGGLRNSGAERRSQPNKVLVENDDGGPVGAAGLRALDVDRLDGGFDLEPPGPPNSRRRAELALGLADRRRGPRSRVLL